MSPRVLTKPERPFVITYSMTTCSGACCTKEKVVTAFTATQAATEFRQRFPLAWVINIRLG